jgi:hypothetical protein
VENALRKKLDADTGYSGCSARIRTTVTGKLPFGSQNSTRWTGLLISRSERGKQQRDRCRLWLRPQLHLFDKTRKWAYRAIRQGWPEYDQWLQACYERASAYNLQFSSPLDDNEVIGIAKSIAKWTRANFSEGTFSDYVFRTHSSEMCLRGRKSKGGGGRH